MVKFVVGEAEAKGVGGADDGDIYRGPMGLVRRCEAGIAGAGEGANCAGVEREVHSFLFTPIILISSP
jgi:hypothetical protein